LTLFLDRDALYRVNGLIFPTKFRRCSVGLSVRLLLTRVMYCGKTADSVEMPFGVVRRVSITNQSRSPMVRGNFSWGTVVLQRYVT